MTYQLHLGIGADLEEFLRVYAGARGISIAAAVRVLLHEARIAHQAPPEEITR